MAKSPLVVIRGNKGNLSAIKKIQTGWTAFSIPFGSSKSTTHREHALIMKKHCTAFGTRQIRRAFQIIRHYHILTNYTPILGEYSRLHLASRWTLICVWAMHNASVSTAWINLLKIRPAFHNSFLFKLKIQVLTHPYWQSFVDKSFFCKFC